MKSALKVKGSQTGFTLIEMLIVIVILGILAAIIIPQIGLSTSDAKLTALKANLSAMRSSLEVYNYQHNGTYPGAAIPATKPADVVTEADAFVAQMTRYTDSAGNISNTKDTNTFLYGPYVKDRNLPKNPFNNLSTVLVDTTIADITTKSSSGAGTGWKFYAKTGVFMAADGAHDAE